MIILGLLQNAWSPLYAGGTWPRDSWLKALWRSRTGQRLKVLVEKCPRHSFWFDNTTNIVGGFPASVVPPDLNYIKTTIDMVKPDVIIAFGKQSQKAIILTGTKVPIVNFHHPAYRVLKNDDIIKLGESLNG